MDVSTRPSHGITGCLSRGIPPRHSMQPVTNPTTACNVAIGTNSSAPSSDDVIALHRITQEDERRARDLASGRLSKSYNISHNKLTFRGVDLDAACYKMPARQGTIYEGNNVRNSEWKGGRGKA